MEELDDKIVEREVEFTDDWFMVKKMDRTPTFAEAIHWADTHPNWVKIEDRLPGEKDGVEMGKGFSEAVLVCGFLYTPKGERYQFLNIAHYRYGDKEWYGQDYEDIKGRVTHWMPIVLPNND